MKLILETDRLLLRELHPDDAEHFYQLNSNPNVVRYTGNTAFKSIEEAAHFLENYQDYKLNGYGRWAVMDQSNGAFLGWCGLKYDKAFDETDIGFRFFETYWNKGYATESAKACIEYGFEKLHLKTIIGRAMLENVASIKVLEKIGLTFERAFDFDMLNKGVIYKIENAGKNMTIELANKSDHEILTAITKKSKSYWGYSEEQIKIWSDLLTITERYIETTIVYKLAVDKITIGYYSYFHENEKNIRLDNLFVLPEYIGKGFGQILMDDFLNRLHSLGINKVILHSEPKAERFYAKFGFVKVGAIETSIKNRFLPIMELNLKK